MSTKEKSRYKLLTRFESLKLLSHHQTEPKSKNIYLNDLGKCEPKRRTTATDDALLIRRSKIYPLISAIDFTSELQQDGYSLYVT